MDGLTPVAPTKSTRSAWANGPAGRPAMPVLAGNRKRLAEAQSDAIGHFWDLALCPR